MILMSGVYEQGSAGGIQIKLGSIYMMGMFDDLCEAATKQEKPPMNVETEREAARSTVVT
jgi:hypothetical protein